MHKYIAVAVLACLTWPAFAGMSEDAILLTKSGVSAEVMLAWAGQQNGALPNVEQIIKMEEANVPRQVIVALLKNAAKPASAAAEAPVIAQRFEPVVASAPQPVAVAAAPVVPYVQPTVSYVDPYPDYYDWGYPYYGYCGGYWPYCYGGGLWLGGSWGYGGYGRGGGFYRGGGFGRGGGGGRR